jgi:transcriptional regulator with XRE-family HTH domain
MAYHNGCQWDSITDFHNNVAMDIPDTLGGRIRWVREKREYEPVWFAGRVGMAPSTLAGLENGTGQKTTTRLHAIVAELQTTVEFLEKGRGEWDASKLSKSDAVQISPEMSEAQQLLALTAQALAASTPIAGRELVAMVRKKFPVRNGTFVGDFVAALERELADIADTFPRKRSGHGSR